MSTNDNENKQDGTSRMTAMPVDFQETGTTMCLCTKSGNLDLEKTAKTFVEDQEDDENKSFKKKTVIGLFIAAGLLISSICGVSIAAAYLAKDNHVEIAPPLRQQRVFGGYCFRHRMDYAVDIRNGLSSYCALSANQCLDNYTFWSARKIIDQGCASSRIERCLNEVPERVYLGRCGATGLGECSPDEVSCLDDIGFTPAAQPNSPYPVRNHTKPFCSVQSPDTLFGSCDGNCVWSRQNCPSENDAYIAIDQNCPCHEVKVGGCYDIDYEDITDNPELWCAVDQDACSPPQVFWTHEEMLAKKNIACYLCSPPPNSW